MAARPRPETSGLRGSYILTGIADGTLLPFVPLLLFDRGLSAPLIGAVLAASSLTSLVAGLGWAYVADRKLRPEQIVVGASAASALAAVLLALSNGAVALAAAIAALSLARSPLMLLDPIALRRLRIARRTHYARIRLRMSAGFAASSVLAGAAYQSLGVRLLPFVYAPLSALFGLWAWGALQPSGPEQAPEPDSGQTVPGRLPKIPSTMVGFLFSSFLLGASLAATGNFLVLQINLLGGGAILVGAAAAFQALTEIPTMGYTHLLTRRLSHRALFAIGCGIYVVVFVAWAFVSSPLVAALLKLAIGVAFALTYVASVLIADELTPARLRATGQALVKSVTFGLAPVAGSFGGGLVYGTLGPRAMFLGATAAVGAAGLIALVAVPAQARRGGVAVVAPVPEPVPAAP
jgi:MFS transporter, PPP family, 3-phenylpropionic acid transporter